jgi:DNA-directed RNA polymerase subunit D
MKIIEKKDNKIVFRAEIEESLANAIRRYMNRIPLIAIDEVDISKNDSPLYDETIAHRIGLIPLKMGKIDEKKPIELKLNVKKEGAVYSEELKGDVKVVYDKIPITILKKGQELELIGKARVGTGVRHPKFSPGIMFYRNVFDIKLDKDCPKEVVNVCPQKIFELKDGNVKVNDALRCDMCEACIEFCRKQKKNSIKLMPTKDLMIILESWGQLSVNEMLNKSIETLKRDLKEVSKIISK